MGYKVYLAIILWRMGIRKILPSGYVNKKPIKENHSPLVDISDDKTFSMDERAMRRGGLWVRRELAPMLRDAATRLPPGVKLHFFGGWRHIAVQWTAWEDNLANKRKLHPGASESEVKRIARLTSADPTRGGFGPHQTGGAIDLTLVKDGLELDMGTPFSHHGAECVTDSKGVTPQQHENRDMLRSAMHAAGFVNYPGEWWHYSYGDRAWAAYTKNQYAVYGKIENPKYKLKAAEKQFADKSN